MNAIAKRQNSLLILLVATLVIPPTVSAQSTNHRITQVTVYRDHAMVTREILVPANYDATNIKLEGLTYSLNQSSVIAESDSPLSIRSVQLDAIHSSEIRDTTTKPLYEEFEGLNRQQSKIEHESRILAESKKVLDELIKFSSKSQTTDLSRGTLDAKALTELTMFSMEQGRKLMQSEYDLQLKLKAIVDAKSKIQAAINNVAPNISSYTATIYFVGQSDKPTSIRVKYLVSNAGWDPQYTVRGKEKSDTVSFQYGARVFQRTNESWEDVVLTLSSVTPAVNAASPILNSLRIQTKSVTAQNEHADETDEDESEDGASPFAEDSDDRADPFGEDAGEDVARASKNITKELKRQSISGGQQVRDIKLNTLAGQLQQIELQASSNSLGTLASDSMADMTNQVYQLANNVTIESGYERQLVQILDTKLKGELTHVVTPLLSSFAFREALVTNTTKVGLLNGTAAIYLDGRFVGQVDIPPTAAGQKLTIGFGADPQVRTRRELLEKTNRINGGNRQINIAYRLVVSNFKNEPVKVRLLDRVPKTASSKSITVALTPPKTKLSTDGLYARVSKPNGILRWDLQIGKERFGAAAYDLFYDYTLEFDRNEVPATMHSLEDILAEYKEAKGAGQGGGGGDLGGGRF